MDDTRRFFCCVASRDGKILEWLAPFKFNVLEKDSARLLDKIPERALRKASAGVPCVVGKTAVRELPREETDFLVLPIWDGAGTLLVAGWADLSAESAEMTEDDIDNLNTFNLLCSYFHSLNENLTILMSAFSEMMERIDDPEVSRIARNFEKTYGNTESLTDWITWKLFHLAGGTGERGHDLLLDMLPDLRKRLEGKGMISILPYLKKCRIQADPARLRVFLRVLFEKIAALLPKHVHVLLSADEETRAGGQAEITRARLNFTFRSHRGLLKGIPFFASPAGFIGKYAELEKMYEALRAEGMYIRARAGDHVSVLSLEFPVPEAARERHERRSPLHKTVLVVEDVAEIRDLLMEGLSAEGFNVLGAADAEQALMTADEFPAPIDALITDVVLPGMDGVKLAEVLSSRHPGLPVLFTSGHLPTMAEMSAEARFLQKPFEIPDLVESLEELLAAKEEEKA